MTVQEIITRTRQIVQQTNPNNSTVSDSTILSWVNEATMQICSFLTTLPKESVSGVTASATLTLATDLLRIDFASLYDGSTYHPLVTEDFNNFVRMNPDWQNQPSGKPSHLVRMTNLNWMMWPTPDATWTGKTVAIYGSVLPDDLTSTSESPAVSVALHHAYPHYCAWLFFLALNNPEKAAAEYSIFDSIRKINTKTATATQGSLLSLKMRGM